MSDKPIGIDITALIMGMADGATLRLEPAKGEFEGPVRISRPVIVDGQGGTIWSKKGPVLRVCCAGVTLKSLNVEITGREEGLVDQQACALVIEQGVSVALRDVRVRGNVSGIAGEAGGWKYPRSIQASLKPGEDLKLSVEFTVPVACQLTSNVSGLRLKPSSLPPGSTTVEVHLEAVSQGVKVRGSITLSSPLLSREISVTGNLLSGSHPAQSQRITYWDTLAVKPREAPVQLLVTPRVSQSNTGVAAAIPVEAPKSTTPSEKASYKNGRPSGTSAFELKGDAGSGSKDKSSNDTSGRSQLFQAFAAPSSQPSKPLPVSGAPPSETADRGSEVPPDGAGAQTPPDEGKTYKARTKPSGDFGAFATKKK